MWNAYSPYSPKKKTIGTAEPNDFYFILYQDLEKGDRPLKKRKSDECCSQSASIDLSSTPSESSKELQQIAAVIEEQRKRNSGPGKVNEDLRETLQETFQEATGNGKESKNQSVNWRTSS